MASGVVNEQQKSIERLQANLLWYTVLRYLILTLLMIVGVGASWLVVGWSGAVARGLIVGVIALILNAALKWAGAQSHRSHRYYRNLALVQIGIDILLVSYLIYAEGAIRQQAVILYAIPILASGFLFGRNLTIVVSGLAATSFSILSVWREFGYRPFDLGSSIQAPPAAYGFIVPIVFFSAVFLVLAVMAIRIIDYTSRTEATVAQEEILSLATHQLRVPATAVKGYLALLHEAINKQLDKKQLKHLEMAIDENNRQLRLVNNLLKTALLDSKQDNISFRHSSLLALIRRAVAEQRYFAIYKNVTVEVIGGDVRADVNEESVAIVLGNLLHNALQYAPPNSTVTVRLNADEKLARICIKDLGPGLTRNEKKYLFRRFSRHNKDDRVAGAGLGLYIAKMLTEKHNGYVEVQSKVKQGSDFCITLPLRRPSA